MGGRYKMFIFLALIISCMVTIEDSTDRTAITFEQGETSKAFSVRTPLQSSAKIVVFGKGQVLGHGSSNYFKLGKYKFIVTAAHVLSHEHDSFILDGEELVKINTIYIDKTRDVALAVPERELINIQSRHFRANNKIDIIGKDVYYAGFPQDLNKALFKGFVANSGQSWVLMQGFALPGSSGSVVFDYWGRAIGVVSAVKVGHFGLSPFAELVETAIIVERVGFINKDFLKEIYKNNG